MNRTSDVDKIIKTAVKMKVSPSDEFTDQIELEVADGFFFHFFFHFFFSVAVVVVVVVRYASFSRT